jgi:hypothetical protein
MSSSARANQDPDASASCAPAVGSEATQPTPGYQTSTQACAFSARSSRPSSVGVPPLNPVTSRAGIPADRSNTVAADANCMQKPVRASKRKWSTAS